MLLYVCVCVCVLVVQELLQRKLPRVARLGMTYHVHDVVGADLVVWYIYYSCGNKNNHVTYCLNIFLD